MNLIKIIAVISAIITAAGAAQQARQGRQQQIPEGTVVHRDIEYVTDGHFRQILDLYLPKSEKKSAGNQLSFGWLCGCEYKLSAEPACDFSRTN
jgi:hypothetical protein